MLKSLIKVRMNALYHSMVQAGTKNKKKKGAAGAAGKAGMAILMAYLAGCFLLLFGMLFVSLAEPFHTAGLDWFYFVFMGMFAFALMFIGSVFMAQSILYDAKDNELLLSLPVPPSMILLSRILTLVLLNLIYGFLVMAPGMAVYVMVTGSCRVISVILVILTWLLLALFSTAVSCLFGALIFLVTSRMKNKTLFSVMFSLVFLGVYFYCYTRMNQYIQLLVANSDAIAGTIRSAALPVYWLGSGISDGNVLMFLPAAACLLLPFLLVYWILSVTFLKLATTRHGAARVKYKEKTLAVSSVRMALLNKELKHYASSAGYILNASLGVAFLVVAAVYAVIKRDTIAEVLIQAPSFKEYLGTAAAAAICGMNSMNMVSSPTVSLEGKNLWIVSSCPVRTQDILLAKVMLHVLICLPAVLLAGFLTPAAFPVDPVTVVLVLAVSSVMTVLFALLGVAVYLKLPKFDWVNETACVKSSAASFVCMFGNMLIVLALALVYLLTGVRKVMSSDMYLLLCTVVLAAVSFGIYRWLMTRGCRIYESLS